MIRKFITMLSCLFLALTMFTPLSRANAWNKKTIFTFSEPVEIPGVALPAGTYVFKLLDSDADRDIVQVFNKNQTKLYATILAIPDYRMNPTASLWSLSMKGHMTHRKLWTHGSIQAITTAWNSSTRRNGPAVIFQEVVHSIGTREADCDEQSSFRGQTEWTSIRMPDSRCVVERT